MKKYTPRFSTLRAWELMGLLEEGKRLAPGIRGEIMAALTCLIVYQEVERGFWERTGQLFRGDTDKAAVKAYLAGLPTQRGTVTRDAIRAQAQQLLEISPREYRERSGQIKRTKLALRIIELHGKDRRGYRERNVVAILGKLIDAGELA